MHCPFCANDDLKVLDSRPGTDGESIRRRRECPRCEKRFTTWERFERARVFVIKRDGSRCEFNKEKVFDSMRLACRKRPISVAQIEAAVDRIEQSFTQSNEAEVSSKSVGLAVMRELSEIDTVAYVRFASVYHEFETVADFAEVVARVQREESLSPFKHLQSELIS